jgi:hypothetical protein
MVTVGMCVQDPIDRFGSVVSPDMLNELLARVLGAAIDYSNLITGCSRSVTDRYGVATSFTFSHR